jgi:hypothetical protein
MYGERQLGETSLAPDLSKESTGALVIGHVRHVAMIGRADCSPII